MQMTSSKIMNHHQIILIATHSVLAKKLDDLFYFWAQKSKISCLLVFFLLKNQFCGGQINRKWNTQKNRSIELTKMVHKRNVQNLNKYIETVERKNTKYSQLFRGSSQVYTCFFSAHPHIKILREEKCKHRHFIHYFVKIRDGRIVASVWFRFFSLCKLLTTKKDLFKLLLRNLMLIDVLSCES